MRAYRKAVIFISIAAVLAGVRAIGAYFDASPGKWSVLVNTFPSKVSPRNAHINSAYYILKQTHEPVLRKDDGQNFSSKVLSEWGRDLTYTNYRFCPDASSAFSKDRPFGVEQLYDHLAAVTKGHAPVFVLTKSSGCCYVSFPSPRRGYLDYLTLYENAPSVGAADDYELGLGAFYVESFGKDRIRLLRKKPVANGYSEIVVHLYKDVYDPMLQNREITDFNLIPSVDVPDWVRSEYRSFESIELKSVNLVINHPDIGVRRLIRECLGVDSFRRAYVPKKRDFLDLQTIFPLGLPGARPGLPEQRCSRELFNVRPSTPIVFLNNRDDNTLQMSAVAESFKRRTGIPLNIAKYPPEQMVAIKRQRPRPYNLIVIVIDAVYPNHEAFFDPFLDPAGYHDFDESSLRKMYEDLASADAQDDKLSIAGRMISELERQSVVLPLYQISGKLYYPPEIKNLGVGRGFLQYPEVAEFRW